MNLRRLSLLQWLGSGLMRTKPVEEKRLRVVNVTRQALLATSLEVADAGARRRKGLLGKKCLLRGEGLWIVPCEAVHTFGMQFSIDVIFLDRKNRIVKTRSNMGPSRLSGCFSAKSVIELPCGTLLDTQTVRGDTLEFTSDPL